MLVLAGCSDRPGDTPDAQGDRVESTVERGPVSMTVSTEPGRITVGERLVLTIDVAADNKVDIQMPTLEKELGSFSVRRSETPPDVPEGERRRFTHRYELDTFASGDVEVPPVTVGFVDRRAAVDGTGESVEGELASEALVVAVDSVLPPDADPTQFRDIKDTVEVPVEASPATKALMGIAVVLGLAVLIAIIALIVRRRRRAEAEEPCVPPHVWAMERLRALQDEQLLERGDLHAFYFRLSDIVRQYIERRFGIMAPQRSTEEFLRETRTSPVLSDEHKQVLAGFLRFADMVKFALHRPSAAEGEKAFAAARRFVEETTSTGDEPLEAAA
jgi:hypothetical protein